MPKKIFQKIEDDAQATVVLDSIIQSGDVDQKRANAWTRLFNYFDPTTSWGIVFEEDSLVLYT